MLSCFNNLRSNNFLIVFTARIRSVVLSDLGNRDHVNDTVIVSGWGYYSDGDLIDFCGLLIVEIIFNHSNFLSC